MSQTIEFDLDSFTFIRAELYRVDDSYDDEFGRQKLFNWAVKGIVVMKHFAERDKDIDVTLALAAAGELDWYKEMALEKHWDRIAS